ncbi:hypothetical protein SLE2022_327420 [Rubroshorea leprosula]
MGSIQDTVHYCCVSRGGRILYAYSRGDHEIEALAALCLERTPPFHKWYFETIGRKTFGFLIEDGCVYFTIVGKGLANLNVLQFLEHVRDEFKKVGKRGFRGSFSNMNLSTVQEQLMPVIRNLIASLEHVSQSDSDWKAKTPSLDHLGLSPSPSDVNAQIDAASSTMVPLLGKPSKQEKKKQKEHSIAVRDIELEEHRKSTERGVRADLGPLDSINHNEAGSSISLDKDFGSTRVRSGPQNIRKKWWRQVRIVLAIDAAVCLVLFAIWLSVCRGLTCLG